VPTHNFQDSNGEWKSDFDACNFYEKLTFLNNNRLCTVYQLCLLRFFQQ